MKTTNYYNTFIQIAEDCPAGKAEVPPLKGDKKTVANLQFEMISKNPYKYTSDDVLFSIYAIKNDLAETELEPERNRFFSKGQACLRSSPLGKRYGWGIHHNQEGKVALYAVESEEYQRFAGDEKLTQTRAMRTKRK